MDVEALGEVVGGGGVLLHDATINSVNIGVGGFFACANVGHTAYQFFLDVGKFFPHRSRLVVCQ